MPFKVLQLNKLYYPYIGGVEHVVQQIAEGLNDRVDMRVLVCQDKGRAADEVVNDVNVHRSASLGVALSMPVAPGYIIDVRRAVRKCDVLMLHMPFPLGDLALLLSGYRGKVVLWWHSDIVRQKKMMCLYKPLMERTLKRADAIIVATEGHINGSEYLPPYRNKCRVVPFGVEQRVYEDSCEYLSLNCDIHSDSFTFLFVGRLVYYKGCDILIRAFASVMGELSSRKEATSGLDESVILRIAGDGPLLEELKALTEELGVKDHVFFVGRVSDEALLEEYRDCDVLVLPSVARSEAFGLVQIEAMSYGKPVINTNLPSGVPYVGVDSVTGYTVEPGDVDALADAMRKLITDPALVAEMGAAARQRVEDLYLMDDMMDRIMKVIDG